MNSCISAVALEQNDRWDIDIFPPNFFLQSIPLGAASSLLLHSDQLAVVEDFEGRAYRGLYHSHSGEIELEDAAIVLPNRATALSIELKELDPLKIKLVTEPLAQLPEKETHITDKGLAIYFGNDLETLSDVSVSYERFQLSRQAALLSSSPDFEELVSLPLLREVELYDHQVKTVKTVLRNLRGRALLCDEVGLGKTVEAGLVLLELLARKLIRKILILTPPSLVAQWHSEMQRKFGLHFTTHDDLLFKEGGEQSWRCHDMILASYHTAKLKKNRQAIAEQHWDLVIIDEAHHLRNNKTVLWQFASTLQKKYILLLTATPMQNGLEDLFNLVTLLKPGLLSTSKQFKKRYLGKRGSCDVKNIDELHRLIEECMIRNRRSTISLHFTKRFAKTLRIDSFPEEKQLYREVTEFVKANLVKENSSLSRMTLLTLQKLMGSAPQTVAPLLLQASQMEKISARERLALSELAERARAIARSAKVERLIALLKEYPGKIVVFTQFRSTQELLLETISRANESVVAFHGSLTRMQKEEAIARFREETRILLSTDSGSEGRNLQFCNAICNFDLPWNPMRIEQRIGRVSRIGQQRDVQIFNLVNGETIEDDVLRVLEAKVNLFELVIGEMDMILGNLEEECDFEEMVLGMWVEAKDHGTFKEAMEQFGDRLVAAKESYLQHQAYDDQFFGDAFSAKG